MFAIVVLRLMEVKAA